MELNISDCFELSRLYFNINEFDIKNTLKYLIGNAAKSSTRGSSISLKCSLSVKKESHKSTRTSCCAWKWLSTVGTWLASTPATVGVEGGEDDQAARASYSLNITVTDSGLGLSKVRFERMTQSMYMCCLFSLFKTTTLMLHSSSHHNSEGGFIDVVFRPDWRVGSFAQGGSRIGPRSAQ